MPPYIAAGTAIPHEHRAQINTGILALIRGGRQPDRTKVFQGYTGKGGLHGLAFKDFANRHDYSAAKRTLEQGQFFTPDWIAKLIADFLAPEPSETVIDPACGAGAFANHFPDNFTGGDIDRDSLDVARYLYPNALFQETDLRDPRHAGVYDYVVGNPPFTLRWTVPGCPMGNELHAAASEDVFLWKTQNLLKPGGSACFVCPEAWLKDNIVQAKALKFIREHFVFASETLLPADAFKNAGVPDFATKIILLRKLIPGETPQETHPAVIDGKKLPPADTLKQWRDATPEYRQFRAGLKNLRGQLTRSILRAQASRNDSCIQEHYRFLIRLQNLSRLPAPQPTAGTVPASKSVPKPKPYEDKARKILTIWEGREPKEKRPENEKEDSVYFQNCKLRALQQLKNAFHLASHPPDRQPTICIIRDKHSIRAKARTPAAQRMLAKHPLNWTNQVLHDNPIADWHLRQEQKTLAEIIARHNAKHSKNKNKKPIKFTGLNCDKITARIQHNRQLLEKPLNTGQNFPGLDKAGEFMRNFYGKLAGKGIEIRELQIQKLARAALKPCAWLAWEMGCGKSLAALAWTAFKHAGTEKNKPAFALITSSALAIELHWKPYLDFLKIPFIQPESRQTWKSAGTGGPARLLLATHHQLTKHAKLIRNMGRRGLLRTAIIDESDEFASHAAARSRAAITALRNLKHRLLLTGTPTRNHASELFNQLTLLLHGQSFFRCVAPTVIKFNKETDRFETKPNPDFRQPYSGWGGFALFKRAHAPSRPTVMGAQKNIPDTHCTDELVAFLDQIRSRLRLSELLDHTPCSHQAVNLSLSPKEQDAYDTLQKNIRSTALQNLHTLQNTSSHKDRKTALLALAHALRLLQQAASPAPENDPHPTSKEQTIIQLIRKSSSSHTAVGTIWKKNVPRLAGILQQAFPGQTVISFDGDDSFKQRAKKLQELNAAPSAILVSTQQSCRSSLNIPIVSEIIAEALPWNFPALNQWAMRFCRFTSKKTVQVRMLVSIGTIEERILGLLMRKQQINNPLAGDDFSSETDLLNHYGIEISPLLELASYLTGNPYSTQNLLDRQCPQLPLPD
jgi:SAM-dependent methyltransferase